MSAPMAEQRAAVARVERETCLILAEAFSCAAQLPEAARDSALAQLEDRRAAFQQSIDALYETLGLAQDHPAAASTEKADATPAPHSEPNATAVQIAVNGLSGPRCTVEASIEWTVRQVKEVIQEMTEVQVAWQRLLKDTEKLTDEVTVGSLISGEHEEILQFTLLVEEVRPINFVGMRNGLEQLEPGHFRKTGGGAWSFNATAVSSESLVVGQGRGLRFRPATTDKFFVIGLGGRSSTPADYDEIDYAAHCGRDGHFRVYEGSDLKFQGGAHARNAEVVLLVHGDRVDFLRDGELQYSSQLRGETQLYAMAAFFHVGGEALEIQWL